MGAYLIDHPPVRDQFRPRNTWRRHDITGLTMLHTGENIMDTIGVDTGAEGLAEFIRRRTDPGSYNDVADSDSWLRLVPLELGAYQDGTGSNGFATSISFACKTSDWRRMTGEQRAGFLRNGARAFADQQRWRKANGHPLTALRYISKAQSDAGESGFCCHGWRDPARRSDPGIAPPNEFPFDEFLAACRAELDGTQPEIPEYMEDDDMPFAIRSKSGNLYVVGPGFAEHIKTADDDREVRQAEKLLVLDLSDDLTKRIVDSARAHLK